MLVFGKIRGKKKKCMSFGEKGARACFVIAFRSEDRGKKKKLKMGELFSRVSRGATSFSDMVASLVAEETRPPPQPPIVARGLHVSP